MLVGIAGEESERPGEPTAGVSGAVVVHLGNKQAQEKREKISPHLGGQKP